MRCSTASLPPQGPVFLSVPMDDWDVEADESAARFAIERSVSGSAAADPEVVRARWPSGSRAAKPPVLVAGPDLDASGAWDAAVALAERQRLPVWASPAPGGGRIGFPEGHPLFQGILPPAIGPVAETLDGHDLVLVAGASVFAYYPYIPGPLLPDGASLVMITNDPDEAARAPMGDAIVADVRLTLERLFEEVPAADRPAARGDGRRRSRRPSRARSARRPPSRRWPRCFPRTGSSCSSRPPRRSRCATRCGSRSPGSYFFGAGGGLGFGLSASIGVQLAQPDRPVVCVIGEGSAQYAITAFWTAVAYDGAGHVPRPAQQRVRDPQVVRRARGGRGRARARPARARQRRDRFRLRRQVARASTARDELARRADGGARVQRPELVEVEVAPGMALA